MAEEVNEAACRQEQDNATAIGLFKTATGRDYLMDEDIVVACHQSASDSPPWPPRKHFPQGLTLFSHRFAVTNRRRAT